MCVRVCVLLFLVYVLAALMREKYFRIPLQSETEDSTDIAPQEGYALRGQDVP